MWKRIKKHFLKVERRCSERLDKQRLNDFLSSSLFNNKKTDFHSLNVGFILLNLILEKIWNFEKTQIQQFVTFYISSVSTRVTLDPFFHPGEKDGSQGQKVAKKNVKNDFWHFATEKNNEMLIFNWPNLTSPQSVISSTGFAFGYFITAGYHFWCLDIPLWPNIKGIFNISVFDISYRRQR